MCFLKAFLSRISAYIPSLAIGVGLFLLMVIFFSTSIVRAVPSFQEFQKDSGSSVHFKLTAISDPESIDPDGKFALHVKIEVSEGWHIYSLDARGPHEESLATEITLHSGSFVPQGPWVEPTPNIVWDGALGMVVKTHEQIVEFHREYRATELFAPGPHEIKGAIVFRACNNKICNLPKELSFKTQIKVQGGNS